MIGRRAFLAGGLALTGVSRSRAAERLILLVGATPGSKSDQVARAFAPFLERHLPGTFVEIRNVPGEAGLAGFRALAEAPPDGTVLGWAATPALPARIVDHAQPGLLEAIRLVGAVQHEPIAFVSPTTTPIDTARALIRRAACARDGMPLATPQAGSAAHLAALQLQSVAGTPLNIVAFPSSAAARQAALAGHVAAASLGLGDAIAELRDGKLVGLGIASTARSDAAPDLPALQDLGLPVHTAIRRGLAAPHAISAEVEARLQSAMQAVIADPEFTAEAQSVGFIVEWLDGPNWALAMQEERMQLIELWQATPWRATGTG